MFVTENPTVVIAPMRPTVRPFALANRTNSNAVTSVASRRCGYVTEMMIAEIVQTNKTAVCHFFLV